MPRNYYRRRSYRRRYYPKKKSYSLGSALSTAGKALTVAYGVKKLLNVERKILDNTINVAPSTSGLVINLTNCSQGDDYNNRQGDSILAKSIDLRYSVQMNASASFTTARCMLVRDNWQQGTDPTFSELLENPTNTRSFLNHDQNGRFTILMDQKIVLLQSTEKSAFVSDKHFNLNHHIKFTGTDNLDASNSAGHLYLMVMSNEATNTPTFYGFSRFRFIDN